MIILKTINNYKLNFLIIILLIFFNFKYISCKENKIIFKINDIVFTSLDLEKRIEYLDFVGTNNIDRNIIIDDFISANLFYEYFKDLKIKENYKQEINKLYEDILNQNITNNKEYKYEISKNNILNNIEIDYIRKIVLENIFNSNQNKFKRSQEEIDLLYNIKVKYINFKVNDFNKINNDINNLNDFNMEVIKTFLNDNNIEFFTKEKEINNINDIDKRIKDNILSNKKFFIIENKNLVSLIFIEKNFETFEGIIANLYSVRSKSELKSEFLNCENLSKIKKQNVQKKEYKMVNLNNNLKQNLVNINDFVKYISDNENIYIVLCDIKFDKEIFNNVNFNKLINLNIKEIEKNFINKYSRIYNLIQFDE